MPAGPIGACWAEDSWEDTAWEENSWGGLNAPYEPAPRKRRIRLRDRFSGSSRRIVLVK